MDGCSGFAVCDCDTKAVVASICAAGLGFDSAGVAEDSYEVSRAVGYAEETSRGWSFYVVSESRNREADDAVIVYSAPTASNDRLVIDAL